MISSSDITRCVVPSRQAVSCVSTTCEGGAALHPLVDQSRAGDVAAQLPQRLALFASAPHRITSHRIV
jgi:hypothetical protein